MECERACVSTLLSFSLLLLPPPSGHSTRLCANCTSLLLLRTSGKLWMECERACVSTLLSFSLLLLPPPSGHSTRLCANCTSLLLLRTSGLHLDGFATWPEQCNEVIPCCIMQAKAVMLPPLPATAPTPAARTAAPTAAPTTAARTAAPTTAPTTAARTA